MKFNIVVNKVPIWARPRTNQPTSHRINFYIISKVGH